MSIIRKVLFVPSDNSLHTGAFISMVKLIQVLRDNYDIEPLVVLPSRGDGKTLLDENNINYKIVNSFTWTRTEKWSIFEFLRIIRNTAINLIAVPQIEEIINTFKPDIVHINTSWTCVGAFAAFNKNIPVVWHIREFLHEDQHRKFINDNWGFKTINKANKVITISKELYKKYEKKIDKNRLCVIYNGVDVARFYNPKKEIFIKEKVIFLCVGSLIIRKGQKELIDACKIIRDKGYCNFSLILVGKGDQETNLKKQVCDLGLEDCVSFAGFQKDPTHYYEMADIFFMVSKNEAFGRVTVEAMLEGLVVIGANSGGTPEIIGNLYGYLYENGNVNDLAEKIIYVLEHKEEARKIMEDSRNMAFNYFSADRNAKEVYDVYTELLNPTRHGDRFLVS